MCAALTCKSSRREVSAACAAPAQAARTRARARAVSNPASSATTRPTGDGTGTYSPLLSTFTSCVFMHPCHAIVCPARTFRVARVFEHFGTSRVELDERGRVRRRGIQARQRRRRVAL